MALPFRYNVLSLFARPTSTASSIALIAVVIAAFAYLQAVTDSAFSTMSATGDPTTIIVLNPSAESETVSGLGKDQINKLESAPDAVRRGDRPIISPEMVAISSAYTHESSDMKLNAAVRGVEWESACAVRHDRVRLVRGRPFQPGVEEVVVGEEANRLYVNYEIGDTIQMGTRALQSFTIVGVFTTDGTAADSEIWGDVETLRDVYGRVGYSSARMLAADEAGAARLIEHIKGPQVELEGKTERAYFRDLNTNQNATQVLSVAMIVIMGIAAAFAVANTMYAAVAGRTREIGMLRAIGFARVNILTAFVLEGMVLSILGGATGCVLSLVFHGMRKSILPVTFTTVSYQLQITPKIIGTSLAVAAAIGLIGSLFPSWRAAKMKVTDALRES